MLLGNKAPTEQDLGVTTFGSRWARWGITAPVSKVKTPFEMSTSGCHVGANVAKTTPCPINLIEHLGKSRREAPRGSDAYYNNGWVIE